MSSLYSMTVDYQQLLNKEELDNDDLQKLDALHDSIEDRIVNKAYLRQHLQGLLNATKEAISTAQEKAKRLAANIEKIDNYVLDAMVANNIDKVDKSPMFDVIKRTNPVSVSIEEIEAIPDEYFNKTETLSLDKKRVKEDIENLGLVIPGVKLVRKISLQIK